MDYRKYGVASS